MNGEPSDPVLGSLERKNNQEALLEQLVKITNTEPARIIRVGTSGGGTHMEYETMTAEDALHHFKKAPADSIKAWEITNVQK